MKNELKATIDQGARDVIDGVTALDHVNGLIKSYKKKLPKFYENEISDGYHSFNELYDFRKMYNALLFNEWALLTGGDEKEGELIHRCKYNVHKSRLHYDGQAPWGDDKWFIVSAMLPTGLISNHYKMEDWDLFKVREVEKALYEFDGHTGKDVLKRLKNVIM